VTEQFANSKQVNASLGQVRGVRVAQLVDGDRRPNVRDLAGLHQRAHVMILAPCDAALFVEDYCLASLACEQITKKR